MTKRELERLIELLGKYSSEENDDGRISDEIGFLIYAIDTKIEERTGR